MVALCPSLRKPRATVLPTFTWPYPKLQSSALVFHGSAPDQVETSQLSMVTQLSALLCCVGTGGPYIAKLMQEKWKDA